MERPVERRRYIRVLVDVPVSFTLPDGSIGVGELVNLSLGGLSFVAQEKLPAGSGLTFSFSLGREMTFELKGRVRHAVGQGPWRSYGVKFSLPDVEELKQHVCLNEFIILERRRQDQWTAARRRRRFPKP